MPKKPRKTRVGTTAWSAQIARDKARHAQEQQEKTQQERDAQQRDWRKAGAQRQEQEQEQQQRRQERQRQQAARPPATSERQRCLRALGLLPASSEADIKKAYKRLSLLYHPDKNPLPSALERMKAINNAFEYLTGKHED